MYSQDLECDVQGLIENREYLLRVAACNENGSGEFLETETPIVAKLPFSRCILELNWSLIKVQ